MVSPEKLSTNVIPPTSIGEVVPIYHLNERILSSRCNGMVLGQGTVQSPRTVVEAFSA
jgi:hypothetical protein